MKQNTFSISLSQNIIKRMGKFRNSISAATFVASALLAVGLSSCGGASSKNDAESICNDSTSTLTENTETAQPLEHFTTREQKESLVIYTPDFSRIDLVCGTMPSTSDTSVIFCAEAAFTAQLLNDFQHSNICGDHVSGGVRYKGDVCKRNSGAFVFYEGRGRFLHKNYSTALDDAAQHGGMGFGQEMMIHEGKRVKTTRPDGNSNEFRALCELNGKICIIDTNGVAKFVDFIETLLANGVTEALYLDMGPGWNFSWWRDENGTANLIHNYSTPYATNWITFYM